MSYTDRRTFLGGLVGAASIATTATAAALAAMDMLPDMTSRRRRIISP